MNLPRIQLLALALTGSALLAQTPGRDLRWPDIGVFGGYSGWDLWRSKFDRRPGSELVRGGVYGARAGWDFTRHLGLEGSYSYGVNNLRLFPDQAPRAGFSPAPTEFGLGARNHHFALNPVWNFLSPDSRLRPYVTAGVGAMWFRPTGDARQTAQRENLARITGNLDSKLGPAFNWGGGIKYNLTRMMQLRLDARNVITRNPHFMLLDEPVLPGAAFISRGGLQSALQLTGGLGFRIGGDGWDSGSGGGGSTSSPADPAKRLNTRGDRALRVQLAGDDFPLSSGATRVIKATTDAPAGTDVRYSWTVNNQGTDATGPDFNFVSKGREPGDYRVCATAMASGYNPGTECINVGVQPARGVKVSVGSSPAAINPGQLSTVTATADAPQGTTVAYAWTVNDTPVDEKGPNYTFTADGRAPGTYNVCATVSAAGISESRECTTVTVRECSKPTISLAAPSATEVNAGDRVNLNASAQQGSCGAPVRINYTASEGAVTPGATQGSGVFDSSAVAFDRANRSALQRKTVTITATATDGVNTAAAQTNVVVKLAPMAQRLDDVLFANRSARVNNCGKRVLLEMLAPKLREDPTLQVVLIGHIDETENGNGPGAKKRGRKSRKAAAPKDLDMARVLNAAAVISAGQGICPALELSRVKVAYAGKKQSSELKPTFCGGSTEPRRKGRNITRADKRAPFRRVEVWLVPNGAAMPPGVSATEAPAAAIKALKCPK